MNMPIVFIIILAILILALIAVGFLAWFDWRGWMVRKVGPNKSRGLAHILIDGVWTYRESALIFEGDDAMSYARAVKYGNGDTATVVDIVPNAIGFDYDEYTGDRVYRVQPGGCIATSDRGDAPAVDYPAELISTHVLDRTVSGYAASVNSENPTNWKPVLIIGVVVIIAVVIALFVTGIIPSPQDKTAPETTGNQTTTEQTTDEPAAGDSGPVIIEVE